MNVGSGKVNNMITSIRLIKKGKSLVGFFVVWLVFAQKPYSVLV
uniref:Uncharacterized protein n=1 Tax=Arundo donax TaxID=35708 RepID=A0A0A9BA30_ARUDO